MGGTQIHFVNVSPGGSTRAANNSVADPVDSSTLHSTQGTGTQGKTRGPEPGLRPPFSLLCEDQNAVRSGPVSVGDSAASAN